MSIQLNELQEKKHSLRRAPVPRAPSIKPSLNKKPLQNQDSDTPIAQLIPAVKLKKTGFRDSLIAEDVDNKHIALNTSTDEPENELLSAIAKRRAKFEKIEDKKEEIKPKPKPKPKPRPQHEDKEKGRNLSSSSDDGGKDNSTDENKNVLCRDSKGEPKLRILPTLDSLGKPPAKPVKPGNVVELLGKYNRANIVIARRRTMLIQEAENILHADDVIVEGNEEQEDYDDVGDELKAQILGRTNGEQKEQTMAEEDGGIFEENYDDVDAVAEKAQEINKRLDELESPEAICEENYDDLDTVAEQVQIQLKNDFKVDGTVEKFGEEMYEAVSGAKQQEQTMSGSNGFDPPIENKSSPATTSPSPPPPREKGKKDLKKEIELQKKKEREEQKKKKEEEKRREKEEREEKRKKEEERKKRERDDKELRKKHKLKPGSEGTGVGEAKSTFAGEGKFELPIKEGDSLTIISENGCPPGKWLVKNGEGHLGYVATELIQLKIDKEGNRVSAIITEDFYEDVDKYQSAGQIEEEADDQEVYDDIGGIDEDFYEELPADQ